MSWSQYVDQRLYVADTASLIGISIKGGMPVWFCVDALFALYWKDNKLAAVVWEQIVQV